MKRILLCMLGIGISTLQMAEASALKGEAELIEEGRSFHQGFQDLVAFEVNDERRKTLSQLISLRQGNVTINGVGYTFRKLRLNGAMPSFLAESIKEGKTMALNHSISLSGLLALQYAVEVNPGKTWVFSLDFEKKE